MAKRSTIGENPLDAVIQEHPLNTVVPDLAAVTRTGRGQPPPEVDSEVKGRLEALETGLKGLAAEVAGLKTAASDAAALKTAIAGLSNEVAGLRQEAGQLKAEAAAARALQAEVTQLKADLAHLRASAAPADLPFWMRGKKK